MANTLEKETITKWLQNNKSSLTWTKTNENEFFETVDKTYISHGEGYKIRDLIIKYYDTCNLKYNDRNFKISYDKIISYAKGKKIKSQELLDYLTKTN